MHTAFEPEGEEIEAGFTPAEGIGRMTDEDLRALCLHLQSLPALEDAL